MIKSEDATSAQERIGGGGTQLDLLYILRTAHYELLQSYESPVLISRRHSRSNQI
jgi:hypothetical protein